MNRFIRRVGDLSARRPWTIIGTWAVLAALVAVLSGALGGAFADDFSAPGSDSATAMDLLDERFPAVAGGTAVAVFAAREGEQVTDFRPAAEAALARVAKIEHVAAVGDPFAAGHVSADGRIAYADIALEVPSTQFGRGTAATLVHALKTAQVDGLQAEFGGDAAFLNAEEEKSGSEVFGLVAALVVLLIAFGTVVAALVPIVLALVAVGVGLAGIVLLAGGLTVSTAAPTIGAMVGLGVGIDYSLLIVSRYRENRAAGYANAAALSAAMTSSGTAVFFAGGTVVLAMGALVLTGVGFLASIGISTSLVVLFAVATAVTLLPALLTVLGDRIDAMRVLGRRRRRAARRDQTTYRPKPVEASFWWRLAHRISARPIPYVVAGGLVMLTLAVPALSLRTGFPDAGDSPPGHTERKAYELLADGFGPGYNAPLVVVADLRTAHLDPSDISSLAATIAAVPGVAQVGAQRSNEAGDTVVLSILPSTGPSDAATVRTLERVRGVTPPGVHVTGPTALTLDLDKQLSDTLPLFIGAILATSILLLMIVFRSVVVPLKAAVMNMLSIGAAYGVVVAVFQWGWFAGAFGVHDTYRIASPLPVIFFAVLFGLSMDYEVFLVSRIREAYIATRDNTEAVARGLASTGRVVTSGALIMVLVFMFFVTNPSPFVKMIGVGLATAVALDATVVRMVLVPATMALMGRANWWLPRWLDRVLPHLSVEGPSPRVPAIPATVPAQADHPSVAANQEATASSSR
jgi:RND superfamily putative drug exporter